jgi:3-deoxy-D-manno-octulosonate 8-phosphate phosphatase (KDO 8-P phosphatase)
MPSITQIYSAIGGQFLSSEKIISEKLSHIKAYIFDWDGVFNNAEKQANGSSSFNEVDSMGTNMLRFSHFLKTGQMPLTAVISGEKNESAFWFCKRECFNYSFFKIANKTDALNFICQKENILPNQVAYFFDDVLDLSMAEVCGIRILVNRKSNPLFKNYCIKNNLVDYITASQSGEFAIREATELLIGLHQNFEDIITYRKTNAPFYKTYIENRRKIITEFYTLANEVITKAEL